MLNAITKWAVLSYSILLMILGVVGYVMADSVRSLVMGTSIGFLLLICSLIMFIGKRIGLIFATGLTFVMMAFFAFRYSITNNLFPALLAVLSGAMFIFLILNLAKWKKK